MKKGKLLIALLSITLPFVFVACLDSDVESVDYDLMLQNELDAVDQTRLAADEATIDDELELWEIQDVQIEPQGVRYVIQTLGTGSKPVLTSTITLKYKGRLLADSVIFDQGDNLQIKLYQLIIGLQTTLPLLPEGTKATLFIPSGLAYGSTDVLDSSSGEILIPKDSNLIFEIELVGVVD